MTDDASVLLLPVRVGLLVGHRSPSLSACCNARENVDPRGRHGNRRRRAEGDLPSELQVLQEDPGTSRDMETNRQEG